MSTIVQSEHPMEKDGTNFNLAFEIFFCRACQKPGRTGPNDINLAVLSIGGDRDRLCHLILLVGCNNTKRISF